ncbi:MAG TPA: M28 family peptidase [Gemmatimonadaceae bacterium]
MSVASPHLARLGAVSRPAGGAAVAESRAYCDSVLRGLGFTTSERAFEYSAVAGAYAMPLAGLLIVPFVGALALVPRSRVTAIVAVLVLVAVNLVARWITRRGVLTLPFARRRGINLEAVRGADEPRVWLVAHVDSKWQPVAMLARVGGVVATAVGLTGLIAFHAIPGQLSARWAWVLFGLACLGAIPLMLSYVGARNHGTVDNASGVAAVLEAAAMIPSSARVGVLITDAEELALAGARAWAQTRASAIALNCDSVDDIGALVVMFSDSRPARLVSLLSQAASAAGDSVRVLRLIPGILTDHVALADAGWETVTLSRGNLRTLQRIHTSRDSLASMRGTGIASAARVLARTATELG